MNSNFKCSPDSRGKFETLMDPYINDHWSQDIQLSKDMVPTSFLQCERVIYTVFTCKQSTISCLDGKITR